MPIVERDNQPSKSRGWRLIETDAFWSVFNKLKHKEEDKARAARKGQERRSKFQKA